VKIGDQELENWIATQLSPRIDFSFREVLFPEGRVVVMLIDSAGNMPVKFKGLAWIRVGSYKNRYRSILKGRERYGRILSIIALRTKSPKPG